MVILIDLNCFLLSFSNSNITNKQSRFASNDPFDLENSLSHSCFLHTSCHFSFCNGLIHFQNGRFFRDRPTSMVTTKRNAHSTQIQTLLQTACSVTDSVFLTCQQVGWFIDRRGKPVGGLQWRRRVPPSLLSCRPAGCLQTTAILLPPTHPPPPPPLE